jgi:hypothetical protein
MKVEVDEIESFAKEYAEVLMGAIDGKIQVYRLGESWDEIYAGNVEFDIDGWKITIFNDCDSIDYTDHVTAPDGREADFDLLFKHGVDPLCHRTDNWISEHDQEILQRVLRRAERKQGQDGEQDGAQNGVQKTD